jgi:hypothetical protein
MEGRIENSSLTGSSDTRRRTTSDMQKIWVGIIIGFAGQFIGGFLGGYSGPIVLIGGTALFVWGCCVLAKSKGHHWGWGFLGLASCAGLIPLAFFPRLKETDPESAEYSRRIRKRDSIFLISFLVGLFGLTFLITWPMYRSYKQAACERAVDEDLRALGEALKKFAYERSNCRWDLEKIRSETDILEFMVGPYYGWKGTNKRTETLMWIEGDLVCACSPKGFRGYSSGTEDTRNVFRMSIETGEEIFPRQKGPCKGKSYGGPDAMCYEESILGTDCEFRKPLGRPCKEIKP